MCLVVLHADDVGKFIFLDSLVLSMRLASIAPEWDISKQYAGLKEVWLNQSSRNNGMPSGCKRLYSGRRRRCYHFGMFPIMNFHRSF